MLFWRDIEEDPDRDDGRADRHRQRHQLNQADSVRRSRYSSRPELDDSLAFVIPAPLKAQREKPLQINRRQFMPGHRSGIFGSDP